MRILALDLGKYKIGRLVRCSVLLRRFFRNKTSQEMAFPHPQSREDKCRNRDIPNHRRVVGKFLKRTVDIAGYRYAKDEVNQAGNPTFTHHPIPFQ